MTTGLWDRETFVENLRAIGARAYHDKHPFHLAMNEGRLSPEAMRGWVANRFYYQRNIPLKDAAILSNCPVREVRRAWIHRILDHDGNAENEGGIEAWLRLGEACGLSRTELVEDQHLFPGVRFAVDAYVNFARTKPWPIAIASSLTELFAPDLMAARLAALITSVAGSLRREATRMRHSRLRWNIATCRSSSARRFARSSLNAMRSGPCLTPFTMPMLTRTISDAARPRLAKGVRLQTDSTTGKNVLLFPEGIVELNETAHEILSRCDGRTLSEIVRELAEDYDADVAALAADVRETLAGLQQRKLIEFT